MAIGSLHKKGALATGRRGLLSSGCCRSRMRRRVTSLFQSSHTDAHAFADSTAGLGEQLTRCPHQIAKVSQNAVLNENEQTRFQEGGERAY